LPAILIIAATLALQSCQKEDGLLNDSNPSPALKSSEMNTFYGPTVPVGNGVARAWVKVNKSGDPESVGVNFTEKALQRLSDTVSEEFVLPFPKMKGGGFYTHALMEWNPLGHPPIGVYDTAHFDFHFYTISNEARMAIKGSDPFVPIDGNFVPPNYVAIPPGNPEVVPQMGSHWIDLLSNEWVNPGPGAFTKTFIWGSYNGNFVFWEPMITKFYFNDLKEGPVHSVESMVPQPDAYQEVGWYAQNYNVSYSTHPNQFTVALTHLKHWPEDFN